jgi:ankyrin repeat protein
VGAHVNAETAKKYTPLIDACKAGNFEIVKILVEAGAFLEARADELGYTPLLTAVAKGHIQIVHYLLEQGADRNVKLTVC